MIKIPFARPEIGQEEIAAVQEVMAGPILVHGPRATEFENSFCAYTGAPYAVSVSSCTAGMHLTYFTLGLGPGDEVLVPAQTHTATAHAVALVGALPVFVDAETRTGNVDLDALEKAITKNTKAIAVVHYLGMPVDMHRVCEIAKAHNLFVVEDCALAIGTKIDDIHAGLFGDVGVFSFYPVKHMTTAEGGMIITRDGELADRFRLKKAFGVDRQHGERAVPGMYDVVDLGLNYRMNELQAAIGIEQVKKLDRFLETRKRNYLALSKSLGRIEGVKLFESSFGDFTSSHYCLSVILDDELADHRPSVMKHMTSNGVGTSIYYPHPVPHFSYYRKNYGYTIDQFPNAKWISDKSIALPVGPHLQENDMMVVANALENALKKIGKQC
jgi:perosamine synthetase